MSEQDLRIKSLEQDYWITGWAGLKMQRIELMVRLPALAVYEKNNQEITKLVQDIKN
jgi:hypothetical protein